MRLLVGATITAALLVACSSSRSSGATTATTATGGSADTTVATEPPASTTTTTPPPQYAATIDALLHLGRPIVLAHTAGEDNFPASTMFAFAQSVKAGVDMLDLNVLLTKDGQLLVQHDDSVDRNTNGSGAVADLTFDQIHALDAAYWFTTACSDCHDKPATDYLYRGIRTGATPPPEGYTAEDFALPTLTKLIERFPDIPLNIEIKGSGDAAKRAADALAEVLHQSHREKATVVASFQDDIVAYFHQIAPDIEVSPGLGVLTAYVLQHTPIPAGMRILQLPPEYSGVKVITPQLIADTTKAGYPIWIWPNDRTLENLASYRTFLAEGIAGLNINFPSQGVQAVREYAQLAEVPAKPSPGCGAGTATAGDSTIDFTAHGLAGTFVRILPPAYDGSTPLPLVLDLHGYEEPAAVELLMSDLGTYGKAQRFITIAPDITRPVPLWHTAVDSTDIQWLAALLDQLGTSLCIDTNRVYSAGLSDGAIMSSTVACALSDRVAAIGTVAGIHNPRDCSPSRPVPVVAFHGTADPYLPYEGGVGPAEHTLPSPDGNGTLGDGTVDPADAASEFSTSITDNAVSWAVRNGCAATTTQDAVAADVLATHWSCPDNGETVLYTVQGGGHTWPGSAFSASIEQFVGHTTMNISADDIMWSFFRHHPLRSTS